MRGALLVLLGGCQLVFPLEPELRPSCEPIGHDEDGDGFDDACDFCPGVADDRDPDRDFDGVGDACDPDPDAACEQRLLFDGFATQPVALITTPTWQHDGDDMLQPDISANSAVAHYPASRDFTDVRVRASATVVEYDLTQGTSAFVIASGGQFVADEPTDAIGCSLFRDGSDYDVRLVQIADDTLILITSGSFSGDELGTFTFELVNRPNGAIECSVRGDRGQGTAMGTASVPQPTGEVFVVSDDASQRLHWFETIANTCP